MKTYMSVSVTRYGETPDLNYGYVYISAGKLDTAMRVDVQTGLKQLARLAKALGRTPELNINQFNPSISYLQLNGFIE